MFIQKQNHLSRASLLGYHGVPKDIEVAEKLVPVKKIDASFFSKGGGNLGDDIAQTQRIYC